MSKRFTTSKRRIERRFSRVFVTALGTTQDNRVLHTAEDSKTLVRTIIKLWVVCDIATAGQYRLDQLLSIAPGGVLVANPSISIALDQPERKQVLWREFPLFDVRSDVGTILSLLLYADLKSMRKMVEGDTIVLSSLATVDSSFEVSGIIVQFFKE